MKPTVSMISRTTLVLMLAICSASIAWPQSLEVHGQASGLVAVNPEYPPVSWLGLRYIPDLLASTRLGDALDGSLELSLNSFATAQYEKERPASYQSDLKLYRAWLRVATDRFEVRAGLQKINFGSALLFRPLMWFDRIDPRDPLQLTDGVYGVLARYYFLNNANIWLWGLYGDSGTKGWEFAPTDDKKPEYGGRLQLPVGEGEAGISYHHRTADLSPLVRFVAEGSKLTVPEDRLGLDGKWDVGIGVWFEAVLIHQNPGLAGKEYQRQWTIGADYTFSVGNGLYVATEYFGTEFPAGPLLSANGSGLSGLSMNYPVDIVNQLSVIVYRDWSRRQWYRIINWQRTYDNWSIYLLGFWNPSTFQVYQSQGGTNSFAGKGFQLMVVFNH